MFINFTEGEHIGVIPMRGLPIPAFFIYVLIRLEDGALLFGSIGLFAILALVMYYSRRVDWQRGSLVKTEQIPQI